MTRTPVSAISRAEPPAPRAPCSSPSEVGGVLAGTALRGKHEGEIGHLRAAGEIAGMPLERPPATATLCCRDRRPAVASEAALRDQRQCPDPYAVGLDDDDAPGIERGGDLRQVGLQERGLVGGSVLAAVSEQDDRWRALLADRKERAEVGIG